MAETELWDGKVPTRNRFMTRTFSWDSSPGTVYVTGQPFINTTRKGLYIWDFNTMSSIILSEDENIAEILVLT